MCAWIHTGRDRSKKEMFERRLVVISGRGGGALVADPSDACMEGDRVRIRRHHLREQKGFGTQVLILGM